MAGGPIPKPAELQMNPRNLPGGALQLRDTTGLVNNNNRANANNNNGVCHAQVDVSTQVDLNDGAIQADWGRRATTALYSREDIKEQYCITSRQLDAVEKTSNSIFGCLTSRGPSPCSAATKASILSACVKSAPSEENLCDAPYPRRPLQIMYNQPYSTYPRHPSRYDHEDEDWIDNSYFRRRPKSFCTMVPDPKRYTWVPEDEESTRMEKPRSVMPSSLQNYPQIPKAKHVSFARSHTLTSFEISRTKSPPRPHNQERLIDSQPTAIHTPMSTVMGMTIVHPYPQPEPRILVLEKQPKRGTMKAQATQTELPAGIKARIPPVSLSPRTIRRVKMVSQGAQTNGMLNGRKLTKSYSEALGGVLKEEQEHEPLQRTQSEEPPRSPFMVSPPHSPSTNKIINGDRNRHPPSKHKRHEIELADDEILIDFKPAPVSPDARILINQTAGPFRRYVSLQKTLSDGEIQIERRELICETSEPTYPHSCRRNHPNSWNNTSTLRQPVQFSSTPDDLALFKITYPSDDCYDEEFHENLISRGIFRKRSVSLEDGVQQGAQMSDYILPRSLPTSPTSPTLAAAAARRKENLKGRGGQMTRQFLNANGIGSPFASSDSLTNDVTKDHSDGIWNESQATVVTPSSNRRHLLILQHQQRSSMDTDALDAEDEIEAYPASPRTRLEAPTPITVTPNLETSFPSVDARSRSNYSRRSPAPYQSNETGKSFARTDSGGRTTDISETSTTDDYYTANTSTGTGTTTGNSATTSSLSRPPFLSATHTGGTASGQHSATATIIDGSSFESASSMFSFTRSEMVAEEPVASSKRKEKSKVDRDSHHHQPSPPRSTTSSSSGSYDVEDQVAETQQDSFKSATHSGHASDAEVENELSSKSTAERHSWAGDDRRYRKKSFNLDMAERQADVNLATMDVSPTLSHRLKSRGKSATTASRSPHRNNKRRESIASQQQMTSLTSPSRDQDQIDDQGHAATSDDSSCSHHYHMHHHYLHETPTRHRRTRDSPRRKTNNYAANRRRSVEDKNSAITGSLPRRRSSVSRPTNDNIFSNHSSPGCNYQEGVTGYSGQQQTTQIVIKSPSPDDNFKTSISAESLRCPSPGSDSVFFNETHCYSCGREVPETIVQPPAGFADSPDNERKSATPKHSGQRLFKKFEKRYRSIDREDRRHRGSVGSRSDIRAKSEERGATRPSPTMRYEDLSRRRLQVRSTDASLEMLTVREDEEAYIEPYMNCEWIYIGDFEESRVWKRSESIGSKEDLLAGYKERRTSIDSTESEKNFKKKYQAATHRMIHRKSSGEMYKRIQTKCFECDKRIIVRRETGGEFGFRIHGAKPVVVSAIEPDTPAETSGLEVGDIVISVNGRSVMDATHTEVVRLAHSGSDILELEVARTCNVLTPQVDVLEGPGHSEIHGEPPTFSGHLWKRATEGDRWVRRWFVLRRNNCLYYYKTEMDSQPVGALMLLKYGVELTNEKRPYSFCVRRQGAPSLHLSAETEDSSKRWVSIISNTIEKNNQDTWLEATLKMQQLPACMIPKADCRGYLSKQTERARRSSSPTGWSRRYCVLKDAAIFFYDDSNAEEAFGVACLHGFRVHSSAPTSGGRKHAFELEPLQLTQRSYIFAADTDMDKKRWLVALEYTIDRWIKIGWQ